MKSIWKGIFWICVGLSVVAQTRLVYAQEPAAAPSPEPGLEDLIRRVQALERGPAQEQPKEGTSVSLSAMVHLDYRGYPGQPSSSSRDGFLLRRARLIVDGKAQNRMEIKLVPEFGEGKAGLLDGYADLILSPGLKLRLGKAKVPFGLERLQSDPALSFQERSLATDLVPDRDLGVQALVEFAGGKIQAAAGFFNGAADGASADAETDTRKEGAARLFIQPSKILGLGGALTYGEPLGTTASTGLATGYKTEGQRTFFSYNTDVVTRGRRFRSTAQAYASHGPLGLELEYIRSSQEVQAASFFSVSAREILNHEAWQSTLSLVLTGEDASYKGLKVRKVFDPSARTWGALELVFRASSLTLDPDTFPVFAYPGASASGARSWGAGVNWILGPNLKVYLDYGTTAFKGGVPNFSKNREDENLLFSRFQVVY